MTGHDEHQPYPHTPLEHERSFIAQARGVEEQLFGLSQDIYNEVMAVKNSNPPTFTQVAADIKKVLDEGMGKISADFLAAPALAADKACGYPVARPGDEPDLPHT